MGPSEREGRALLVSAQMARGQEGGRVSEVTDPKKILVISIKEGIFLEV